ncbi:MAG: hypothetical protein H0T65_12970, partial [Deltaproteobacteria bacterium]|nr:hypothetical protein [Deltaproteobacteria bacterium]
SWLGREDDGERLVVGWVLPGAAPAANVRAVDDQTATLLRKQSDLGLRNARGTRPPSSDDQAMTVPHTKFDETLPPRPATPSTIAHGTPTFNEQPPRLDPNELFGWSSPLAPDATFKVRKPTADEVSEEEEPTAVGKEPEPELETQKLQPPRRATKRLFHVKSDT